MVNNADFCVTITIVWLVLFRLTHCLTLKAHTSLKATTDYSSDASDAAKRKVVVVGGGVGGLAVASRIASSSFPCEVSVVEKNSYVGGRCGSFDTTIDNVGTFRHERGPSLLLLPDVYRDVFKDCTTQSADDFGLVLDQCMPAYQIVFEDGDSIEVGFPRESASEMTEDEKLSRQKMDSYETDGAEKWDEYMRATSAFLDCGLPNFIEERFDLLSFPAFLIEALRESGKAWPLKPHSDVLDATFDSEKMKALASFQDLYVGLEPFRNDDLLGGGVLKSTAPAVFGLLAAIELHPKNRKSGVFAPQGGFQAVSNALEKLATSLNVEFQCGKTVTGVKSDGVHVVSSDNPDSKQEFIPADLVIVNADLPYATKSLLMKDTESKDTIPKPPIFDWDDKFSFSSGVISFHWSISKPLDDLNTHNVFMSAGSRSAAEASWQVLRENTGNTNDPFNFYVHRASKTDPTAAPAGCDSIMILVPCRTLLHDAECKNLPRDQAMQRYRQQFSEDVVDMARKAVLNRLGAIGSLKDLEGCILDEVVDTPATWADKYNLAAGTPFALSHGFSQLSLFRPGPASSRIPNVLFCGASSRPGNGVPLVLIGAKQVAEKAVRVLEKQQLDLEESLEREEA